MTPKITTIMIDFIIISVFVSCAHKTGLDKRQAAKYAQMSLEEKNATKSLEYINKSIDIDSQEPLFRFRHGLVYIQLKEFNKAIDEFNFCIKLNTKVTESYYSIANSYLSINNYKYALLNYMTIALNP